MPKYVKPKCDRIENLLPAIIVDQEGLGSNVHSTVGTYTEIYSALRVFFTSW